MKRSLTIMAIFSMLALGIQAQALPIAPGGEFATGVTNPTDPNSPPNSQSAIDEVLATLIPSTLVELGFQFDALEDGSGGTISNILGDPNYLFVKDGNHTPWWYLFQLPTLAANDSIVLSGFWLDNGEISHVNLYGTSGTAPVPEPATLLLLGSGLLGLALYGRKRMKG